jgi:hypothetical protein
MESGKMTEEKEKGFKNILTVLNMRACGRTTK